MCKTLVRATIIPHMLGDFWAAVFFIASVDVSHMRLPFAFALKVFSHTCGMQTLFLNSECFMIVKLVKKRSKKSHTHTHIHSSLDAMIGLGSLVCGPGK